MISDPVFLLSLTGLIVTCLAAIGARSLAEFAPHELKEICRRGKSPDRLGQILRRHDDVALAVETLQVVATATFLGAGAFLLFKEAGNGGPSGGLLWTAIFAGAAIVLLAVEIWIPWAVARLWAEPFIYHTWNAWQAVRLLLAPLVLVARFLDTLLHRLAGRAVPSPRPATQVCTRC